MIARKGIALCPLEGLVGQAEYGVTEEERDFWLGLPHPHSYLFSAAALQYRLGPNKQARIKDARNCEIMQDTTKRNENKFSTLSVGVECGAGDTLHPS